MVQNLRLIAQYMYFQYLFFSNKNRYFFFWEHRNVMYVCSYKIVLSNYTKISLSLHI